MSGQDNNDSDSDQSFDIIYCFGETLTESEKEIMMKTMIAEHNDSLGSSTINFSDGDVDALDSLTRAYDDPSSGGSHEEVDDKTPLPNLDNISKEIEEEKEGPIDNQNLDDSLNNSSSEDEEMKEALQSIDAQKQSGINLIQGLASTHQKFKSVIENLTKPDQPNIHNILSHHLNTIPTKILIATICGFIVSFFFFLSYTLVIETQKYHQLQHYANLTKEERQYSETYRQGQDSLREMLMHKSYEDARLYNLELQTCRDQSKILERELATYKATQFNLKDKIQELELQIISKQGDDAKFRELKVALMKLRDENKDLKTQTEKYKAWLLGGVVLFALVVAWGKIRVGGSC